MKINWGTSIIIAFILFISFIMFFVIKTFTQEEYTHDLVDEEYYKTELKYQEQIDKLENAKNLAGKIEVVKVNDGIEILFPSDFTSNNTTGIISFYRSSNKLLDFKETIDIVNNQMLISKEKLVAGHWEITIDFVFEEGQYLYKKALFY